MLPILVYGRSLTALQLHIGDPIIRRLCNRDAAARRDVDARRDIDTDGGVVGVGVLLLWEVLRTTLALPVAIINEPRLAGLALGGRPVDFAYRHVTLPSAI